MNLEQLWKLAAKKPSLSDNEILKVKKCINDFLDRRDLGGRDYILTGGAALAMHGLRKKINDLDLVVPDMNAHRVLDRSGDYEIDAYDKYNTPIPSKLQKQFKMIKGVRVATKPALLALKRSLNRPKDQDDIKKLIKS